MHPAIRPSGPGRSARPGLLAAAGGVAAAVLLMFRTLAGPEGSAGKDEFGYPTNTVEAARQGRADARRDLDAGRMVIRVGGLPALEWEDYRDLLKTRCGVELRPTHGCLVTAGLMEYTRAYNAESVSVVTGRFGGDILDRLWTEARERYRHRLEARSRSQGPGEPPGVPAPDAPGGERFHVVRPGDTLIRIATAHGIRLDALRELNPGVDPRRLRIGQRLALPAAE